MKLMLNFNLWAELLLPTFARTKRWLGWMRVWLHPAKTLNFSVLSARQATLKEFRTTGQVYALREKLNDLFDPFIRRIDIAKTALPGEFKVRLPVQLSITGQPLEFLENTVRRYKQAGSTYLIEYYIA